MSATALIPLTCYTHPNKQQSLLKYPNVICGTDVHASMLAIGVSLLIVGVFGFLSLCTYAAYMVLATDYPAVQTVWVTFILLCFLACQALAWPWKVPLLNALDCWMSYCIMILVAASALYLEPINKTGVVADFVDNFNTGIMVVIFSSISSMIIMAVCALFHRAAMGGNSEYAVEKAFDALAVFDTRRIMNFMTMMSSEVLVGRSDLAYGTRAKAKAQAIQAEEKPAEGGATTV
eukprot:s1601_g6.t1